MTKYRFFLFLLLLVLNLNSGLFAQTKAITLEDLWLKGAYQPENVYGINWMKNSQFYTAQDFDPLSRTVDIVKYDVKTGNKIETLIKGSELKDKVSGETLHADSYFLSPDETKILLAVNEEPIYRRSSKADFYIYELAGKKLLKLSEGKIMHPSFSPDGKKIAFVKDNNLWLANADCSGEKQVTTDGAVNKIINGNCDWVYEEEFEFTQAYFWSPDSKKIAFYKFDESEVREYTMQVWNDLYPENYNFKYPKAGEKNSDVSIHIYDTGTEKTLKVNTGEGKDLYIPRVMWTQDPSLLSVQRLNRLQNHFEILHANAVSGESKVVYEEKNSTYVEIRDDLTYLQDKKHFLLLSEKDGYRYIYMYGLDGKEIKQLTTGNWEVRELEGVDEKTKTVYFTSTEVSSTQNHLYSVNFSGEKKKKLTEVEGYHDIEISPDNVFYLDYQSQLASPSVITVNALPSGKKVKELVNNQKLSQKLGDLNLQKPEFFTFKTSLGAELNGYIIKPAGFDPSKKYPVLLTVYGGPGHQTVLDQWAGPNYLWFQMLAQKGYIVYAIDNRGTGGKGAAFKKVTQNKLGKLETEDVIEAAKYFSAQTFVDSKRIGIFGWSFGGYLSSLAMTVGADFFKLGIAVAPVTSWRFYDTIYTERFLGLPSENAAGYDENSPITHAAKLKGKYLLIHGTADDNVHIQNSFEMQKALNKAGIKYDVFYYPDKNHGIYGGNTRYHLYSLMTDYILGNL